MKNLFKALADFQNEVPIIHEETQGYNYTYSNINTIFKVIKPLLLKHGLGFTQFLNGDSLNTLVYHIESGDKIESSVNLLQNVKLSSMNDYQVLGSGITYLRRYSLSCLLGLITDKDIDAGGEQVTTKQTKTAATGMSIKRELTKKDVEKWNGKLYKGNCIYVGTEMIECSLAQLEKLKAHKNYKPEAKISNVISKNEAISSNPQSYINDDNNWK